MTGQGVTDKEYWDSYWGSGAPRYANYDGSRGPFYAYRLLLSECLARTRSRRAAQELKLVDCGCGEGLILRFVHEQFADVELWGIDYSEAIEKARRMARDLGYDFHLVRADLFEVGRSGELGPFDVLISVGLIEHFQDPAELLAKFERMVAPGGCLITIIPNFGGLHDFLWRLYDAANYRHHVPISNSRLLELHRSLGLEDIAFFRLGTPTVPGIHGPSGMGQKLLNQMIVQINGRILQRLWPRQESLGRQFPMTPVVACAGWKPSATR
jgi:SAM-dependent methyltransferase